MINWKYYKGPKWNVWDATYSDCRELEKEAFSHNTSFSHKVSEPGAARSVLRNSVSIVKIQGCCCDSEPGRQNDWPCAE